MVSAIIHHVYVHYFTSRDNIIVIGILKLYFGKKSVELLDFLSTSAFVKMCKIREHEGFLQSQSWFFIYLIGLLYVHVYLFVLPRYPDSNSLVILRL